MAERRPPRRPRRRAAPGDEAGERAAAPAGAPARAPESAASPRGEGPGQPEAAARARTAPLIGQQVAVAAPPEQLQRWGVPSSDDEPGDYIVELNLQHRGALQGAEQRFKELYAQVIPDPQRQPIEISRTYFSCLISLVEQRRLVHADRAQGQRQRSIYRIWPDFEVTTFIDRSVSTVKADAARRSYAATGRNITWAVVDSGIDRTHPHFQHFKNLDDDDVVELHRDFTVRGEPTSQGALEDGFGHGTHVAGIIAGGLPEAKRGESGQAADGDDADGSPWVFEKVIDSESDARAAQPRYERRAVDDPTLLTGVAPSCRLVSLKVLDANGVGRASNVMRALHYIRENVNADPKVLRIHGVNISAGYEFSAEVFACGQSPLCVEVDRMVRSGVVVVVASGNTGYGQILATERQGARAGLTDTINDPGNAELAITVGSTHRHMPHTYGVSYFSSKGPTGDGRLKPDVVAPGERITSCAAGSWLDELRAQLAVQAQDAPPGDELA